MPETLSIPPRIALFQARWPMQPLTSNAVRVLCKRGFQVDVFLYDVSEKLERLEDFGELDNSLVRIIKIDPVSEQFLNKPKRKTNQEKNGEPLPGKTLLQAVKIPLFRFRERIKRKIKYTLCIDDLDVLPPCVYTRALEIMHSYTYKAVIGIERYGLAWAGFVAERMRIRLAYWSYELYTNDHPRFKDSNEFKRSKRVERKYHPKAEATIIQDEDRAEVLYHDNRTRSKHTLLVPVSMLGEPNPEKSDYLHRMHNIPAGKKIILSFGTLAQWRLTHDLMTAAQSFPEDRVLILHGACFEEDYLHELHQMNKNGRAVFSLTNVPADELTQLVASADIGLVFYPSNNQNDLLAARSSYKTALYAQSGIPMIANDYPSFVKFFQNYGCGATIGGFSELNDRIDEILTNYSFYRDGAIQAYKEVYEFSDQFNKVLDWIGIE